MQTKLLIMVRIKVKHILLIIFLNFIFINTYESTTLNENKLKEYYKIEFYKNLHDNVFSEELLRECLIYEEVQNIEIVIKQARLETGNYTSDLFKNGNNLFGMKYPRRRITTAIGKYKGHAKYDHWIDSVKDYKLFQDWYLSKGFTFDNYYAFLNKIGYAVDKRYITKLKI